MASKQFTISDFAGQFPPLLTTRRAVAFTGVSRHAIGRAVKAGQLAVAGRRGRRIIFRRVDLERWLVSGDDAPPIDVAARIAAARRSPPIPRQSRIAAASGKARR